MFYPQTVFLMIFSLQGIEELPDVPAADVEFGILPTEIKLLVERRKQV